MHVSFSFNYISFDSHVKVGKVIFERILICGIFLNYGLLKLGDYNLHHGFPHLVIYNQASLPVSPICWSSFFHSFNKYVLPLICGTLWQYWNTVINWTQFSPSMSIQSREGEGRTDWRKADQFEGCLSGWYGGISRVTVAMEQSGVSER